MAKEAKRTVRANFRCAVFERDRYRCACCGILGRDRQGGDGWKKFHKSAREESLAHLDAHHICSRDLMPNGGYVAENGISVCDGCHLKAEAYWATGRPEPGFEPESLYAKIGSSYETAFAASEQLGDGPNDPHLQPEE